MKHDQLTKVENAEASKSREPAGQPLVPPLPVVRGSDEHEAVVLSLTRFLEVHAPTGRAGRWLACLCGWGHDTVSHAEHVAATAAVQRPWIVRRG